MYEHEDCEQGKNTKKDEIPVQATQQAEAAGEAQTAVVFQTSDKSQQTDSASGSPLAKMHEIEAKVHAGFRDA